ncbi:hypothetical protein GCM10022393_09470 [Aquimarina addita]|uniref:DUF4064 domain-containing protein n=1 Tax=Aquimarina addita TaxID=870485 RepID=A0ABP7XCX5_9FLAO
MENYVPRVSTLLFVLIIGLLFSSVAVFFKYGAFLFLDAKEIAEFQIGTNMLFIIGSIVTGMFNLFIAIWLCLQANKKGQNIFVWFLFGLFFGIIGIILFYLIVLIEEIKILNANYPK